MKQPYSQVNTLVAVDAYETGHYEQYPKDAVELSSYLTFRTGMELLTTSEKQKYRGWVDNMNEDDRIVWFGMRYVIETFIAKPITHADIDEAAEFYSTFNVGETPYPFPEKLFRQVVDELDGVVPLKIQMLPEGSVVYPNTPVAQVTAQDKWSPIVSWFEAITVMTWYPATVATLSRRVRDFVEEAFERSVDEEAYWKIPSRLHNFGFRGGTSLESGIVLAALSVAMVIVSPLGGHLVDRFGRRLPTTVGLALLIPGALPIALAGTDVTIPILVLGLALVGAGIGLSSPGLQTTAVESVDQNDAGVASGVYATSRYLGSIIGSALLAAVLGAERDNVDQLGIVFAIVFASAILATLSSFALRPRPGVHASK